MNAEIILQRPVQIRCWQVIGQVAKATKRVELIPLLVRARERGETDAIDIAGHLFFESRSRRIVAQRMLQIAAGFRLLEEHDGSFILTAEGEQALSTEQVFVPEHGTWTIWASEDALLPAVTLRVMPWTEPTAYDEIWGQERERSKNREFEKLPDWLRDTIGDPFVPAADTGRNLRLDSLEQAGSPAPSRATLTLEWNVTRQTLRLKGQLDGNAVSTDLDPPALALDHVWRALLDGQGLLRDWDPHQGALRVAFIDTEDVERESMVRALSFNRPRVPDLGQFAPLTVSGIPIAVRSLTDAQRWAEWRLVARAREYATEPRYDAWSQDARAPFTEHQVQLPARSELAERAWRDRSGRPSVQAWHLIAAEDWSL